MNEKTFQLITAELSSELIGQKFGKLFSISRNRFAIDFRLPDSKYLFISIEPNSPRMYLITRRFKDLENESKNPSSFIQYLRSRLSNGTLTRLEKYPAERVIKFTFSTRNDVGGSEVYKFVGQFTGRSANLFLLDSNEYILDSCRNTAGQNQQVNEKYSPPIRETANLDAAANKAFDVGKFSSLSEALDSIYFEKESENRFKSIANSARSSIRREISKRQKLIKNLKRDLNNHGDAETWKRFGDLLLANLAIAKREGQSVWVTDYFDEATPIVEVIVDENDSISDGAEKYFKKYTKARNARQQISSRLGAIEGELAGLQLQSSEIEQAISDKDLSALQAFESPVEENETKKLKSTSNFNGAKRFVSTDGYEILVGKRAKDNDFLTFRIAKSLDYWFHASDYPGSHVVVRNPNRNEISQTTLIEAAQIAAFYSQARSESKVAVHYTQKKFVNKPKGAAPGMVSLASFKTVLVTPQISVTE